MVVTTPRYVTRGSVRLPLPDRDWPTAQVGFFRIRLLSWSKISCADCFTSCRNGLILIKILVSGWRQLLT